MPDENKKPPLFGGAKAGTDASGDSGTTAPVTNAEDNATATTTTPPENSGTGAQNEGVTDAEAAALDGAAGPNRTPAFAKRDFEDENVQLTDTDDLASAKAGAAAASGSTLDFAGIEAAAAAGELPEGAEDEVQFTSTPISRLRVGPFQFENGVLRLKAADADKFEKLLASTAIRTQQVVRKIDRSAGEAVARRFVERNKSKNVRGGDTSDRATPAPTPRSDA